MNINEIKHRNLLRLCRKYKCEEPTRLAVILGASKQHASQLLKGKSTLGNLTIGKLCKTWKISADEFIKVEDSNNQEKINPSESSQEISWELKTIIDEIRSDIKLLTIGVQSLESSKKSIRAELKSINDRLNEYAKTGDKKKLHAG